MTNQDLFKQAIAEAKSIREAAISNAKEALEESLTPHLKELLAAKLQEMDEDEDKEHVMEADHEDMDEAMHDKEVEEAENDSEESEDEADETHEDEEEIEVKDMEIEDLKNLIRDIVAQETGNMDGEEEMDMDMDMDAEAQPEDMVGAEDEEINLEELLAELEKLATDEDMVDEAKKKHNKEEKEDKKKDHDKEDLKEAMKTIKTLQHELSEVNTLNAKLLYLNKVFRANNLTENQKVGIITAFDKASSLNEVKLVYETLKNSFQVPRTKPKTNLRENKGFASAPTGSSTKPNVITEVNEQVLRMQKLAGIIR